jgi:glutamate dehydrogenase (NAD(P)+)
VQDLQSFFWSEEEITRRLEAIMVRGFQRIWALAEAERVSLRTAALILGVQRVAAALMRRGIYP